MPSDLLRRLRGLYPPARRGQAEHCRAHEDELLAKFVAATSRESGSGAGRGGWRWPRLALAGGLSLAVAVGACALPAEYPVSLGRGLEITVDAERWEELDAERVAQYLSEELGAERVEIHVTRERKETVGPSGHAQVSEAVRLQLFAFGGNLDPELTFDELQDEFPALLDAELHQVPLAGTVHGTLGGKLSRHLLDLTIDTHGVEEAEQQIRRQLMAQGIAAEDAIVDISTEEGPGGHREIRVRVEAEK